jgi:hypothetical protein
MIGNDTHYTEHTSTIQAKIMHTAGKTKRYAPARRFSRCAPSARLRRRSFLPPVGRRNALKGHGAWLCNAAGYRQNVAISSQA